MSPLERARERLTQRFAKLDAMVDVEHPLAPEWDAYLKTALALEKLAHSTTPATPLLTTKQMAQRMNVHPKTLLRRASKGQLSPVAGAKGTRGSRLRWAAP